MLGKLDRLVAPSNAQVDLKRTLDELNRLKVEFQQEAHRSFDDWLQLVGAALHPIHDTHATRVFDKYFEGGLPFRQKKSRTDLPDAFIAMVAEDIAESVAELHVVVGDGVLRAACDEIPGVITHEDLDHFIGFETVAQVVRDVEVRANAQIVLERVAGDPSWLAERLAPSFLDAIADFPVVSWGTSYEDPLGNVSYGSEPQEVIIVADTAVDYGGGMFWIPFHTRITACVYRPILKSEYYLISDERAAGISVTDLNEHYYTAEEEMGLEVGGNLLVIFDEKALTSEHLSPDTAGQVLERAEVVVDAIEEVRVLEEED